MELFSGDKRIRRETRLTVFPTGAVALRVGIFLSNRKSVINTFHSHAIKKTVPSSLVAHTEMPEQNDEKYKFQQTAVSDQSLPSLPLVQQFLDTPKGSIMELFSGDKKIQWETRLAVFPTGAVALRVGIFLSN